jgi:two-component system chemotaxis sensor kinase CheA
MAADPYKYFRIEAQELVDQLGAGVLVLERDGAEAGLLSRLLRFAHTLKGAARVVKEQDIARMSHELEDLLAPVRDRPGPVGAGPIARLLALLDAIGARVRGLSNPTQEATQPDEAFRTLRTDVAEMDALLGGIARAQAGIDAFRRNLVPLENARRAATAFLAQSLDGTAAGTGRATAAAQEIVASLAQFERGLAGDAEGAERELREVRALGERLRLLPVQALFGPLERTARDACQALGKRAVFRGEAGDVRLDGDVLAALQPALVQLVRNAIAHGIEPEAERVAAGKAAEGKVVLSVTRRGTRISFACRDDGRGIDLTAVEEALRRKGQAIPDGPRDQASLLRALLGAGVSTATTVTPVSGRGIGLDVVREATSSLGGEVILRTEARRGTTVEISVPVSLSSVEALMVAAGSSVVAIPMDAVVSAARIARQQVAESADGATIPHEGSLIPFAPLSQVLGRNGARAPEPSPMLSVVVLRAKGLHAAVEVDRFVEGTTVLVRALPTFAAISPLVAGLSIDAAGNPRLVLDPERLSEAVRANERPAPASVPTRDPILVVDDSLTTRMLEQSILESAGYRVDVATCAEDALERVRERRYGLLLVDVEMPGMNGFELLEQLQADPELRSLPCILVTSRDSREDRERGARAGARAHIVKSEFDQVDLLRRIGSLVR